jgi:hypothetical protein
MKVKFSLYEKIWLSVIISFGAFLRLYQLGKPAFWVDEATSANVAISIMHSGLPVLFSGGNSVGALFLHYSMALFGLIFGSSEFSFRLVSVIFGLLTIVLAFFIGKEYSKSGGIISALFFSVFYLEVFFSRQSRYYQLFQLAFFASIYFLYKSKDRPIFLLPAIICLFITIDTHIEGLILAAFFVAHILIFNRKQWFAALISAIPLISKLLPAAGLSSGSIVSNYASRYLASISNMFYLLILFVPGLILSFIKKRRLTLLLVLPSLFTLVGIFSLETFAMRYSYFFMFPLLLYSALLFSFIYDKYGKWMLIPIIFLIIIPSNLFFPQTYVNVIRPIDYNLNDYSAPFTDYKAVPAEIIQELKSNVTLISYYSPDVSYYIRKPDYVLPFSLDGRGEDQVSFNNSLNQTVDRYSGALILDKIPVKPYHLIVDSFSVSKLKPNQMENFKTLSENCSLLYNQQDVKIFKC